MSSSLDQTRAQPQDRVYEDFDPPFEWDKDEKSHTLVVMLPGFRKEQLRVQITSKRTLRLSAERNVRENKWRRFYKELPVPHDSDTTAIAAKFDSGVLYVTLPKVITPMEQPIKPPRPTQQEAPKPPQQPPKPAETPNNNNNNNNAQVDAANKEKPKEDKAKEPKPEKPKETTQAPTPTPTAPKEDEDSKKKEKSKEDEIDANKITSKEKVEAATSKAALDGVGKEEEAKKMEKRLPTMELLSSQTREYKNAVSALVEDIKKQKKLANLVVVILLALVFVLYLKNAIKSSFGGSKHQEL